MNWVVVLKIIVTVHHFCWSMLYSLQEHPQLFCRAWNLIWQDVALEAISLTGMKGTCNLLQMEIFAKVEANSECAKHVSSLAEWQSHLYYWKFVSMSYTWRKIHESHSQSTLNKFQPHMFYVQGGIHNLHKQGSCAWNNTAVLPCGIYTPPWFKYL